ncbi:transposase [Pelagibaculum spongiae]|uniref:Transposase n=1 Tax=Pelagibaculum spongiae TaxID=2080658 RepID=A0A2V1H187_9GAMM|nr:transposase [Pelagibaculum spongiae]PVZ72439.1 transposase [Pelagibaculum spongiae]
MTGHHFNSVQPLSDSPFDFGRRYTDTVEIAKVGPRRVGMNPQFCHWFHCVSRVCRKAWLCGVDPDTGESFEHRRDWIVKRLALLADAFSIEIASYAVMSNHYHLVLCVNLEKANSWSSDEVLRRWCKVYQGPEMVRRYLEGDNLMPLELQYVESFVDEYRQRLVDLSWFMRSLNEPLARMANKEDKCTGHFWEGRFKAQALLDEQAILTCMAYVDLNPLRAGMAKTPEQSDYTSIQQRILRNTKVGKKPADADIEVISNETSKANLAIKPKLKPFKSKDPLQENIPFSYQDYLILVDQTARIIRSGKAAMDNTLPPIIERLNIDQTVWIQTMGQGGNKFHRAVGCLASLRKHAVQLKQFWVGGSGSDRLFKNP